MQEKSFMNSSSRQKRERSDAQSDSERSVKRRVLFRC